MKKHEEDWVPVPDVEIYYGKGGNICDENECYAKILKTSNGEFYFVWTYRGSIFDPYGSEILRRSNRNLFKLTRVSRDCFDNYFKYLKSKNRIFYTLCDRNHRF